MQIQSSTSPTTSRPQDANVVRPSRERREAPPSRGDGEVVERDASTSRGDLAERLARAADYLVGRFDPAQAREIYADQVARAENVLGSGSDTDEGAVDTDLRSNLDRAAHILAERFDPNEARALYGELVDRASRG